MPATLAELAARYGCKLNGVGDTVVTRVGTLSNAGADAVTFLANPLYRSQLAGTRAAAVILDERYREECPVTSLVNDNPYATYARIADTLGVAVGTVGWILHRARRSLRTSLNDLIEDER